MWENEACFLLRHFVKDWGFDENLLTLAFRELKIKFSWNIDIR